MKEIKTVILALGSALSLLIIGSLTHAGSGWDGADWLQRGNSIAIRKVVISSTTGTALWVPDPKRPDSSCRNVSSYTIFLGTVSVAMQNQEHTNITNGFPLQTYETFSFNGTMSGVVYATCNTGVESCEARCLDGKVN